MKQFPFQEHPWVAVDVVIFTIDEGVLKALLVELKEGPFVGRWAFPGGLVGVGEALEDAARRELFEKTGLRDLYLEQLYTFGEPTRDPHAHVVSVAYFALLRRHHSYRAVAAIRDTTQLLLDVHRHEAGGRREQERVAIARRRIDRYPEPRPRRLAPLSGRAGPTTRRAGHEHRSQHAVGHRVRPCWAGGRAGRAAAR